MTIRFDGRVAIVTGGGRGLGRSHALALGRLGAHVVVNDTGGGLDGQGSNDNVAEAVVAEIRAAGGEGVADFHDVSTHDGGQGVVQTAVDAYDTVDIVVNNAGYLRDRTFGKIELDDFDAIIGVHLLGNTYPTHAAWPIMRTKEYGRVVFTTSAAGLYGNFGQTNYAAGKLAVVGLMNALKLEGDSKGIRVNTIAPVATTRMTESLMGDDVSLYDPGWVTPAVVYLCSDECEASGAVVEAGGGYYSLAQMMEGAGVVIDADQVTPDDIAARWSQITDMTDAAPYRSATDITTRIAGLLEADQS
ncbi:MAG: SDR family NAD(P)-dependent oxidoreductase [Actinomycetia bacterium]|nr:SDR family NAD(P)-dependent oxidoreductase [Actinomycetes bacterium]